MVTGSVPPVAGPVMAQVRARYGCLGVSFHPQNKAHFITTAIFGGWTVKSVQGGAEWSGRRLRLKVV